MQVVRGGFLEEDEQEQMEPIAFAGLGDSISVVLKYQGLPWMMGKYSWMNYRMDDYRKFSRPQPMWKEKIKITKIAVGNDHVILIDDLGSLYGAGDCGSG